MHLSRYELIQKIEKEIYLNPFLEKNDDEFDEVSSQSLDEFDFDISASKSLQDSLHEQIEDLNLSAKDKEIAFTIVESIDETGKLADSIDEVEELLSYKYKYEEIQNNLHNIIHHLEPHGVGYRDYKECIFLQLRKADIAIEIFKISEKILFEITSDDLDECFNKLSYQGYKDSEIKEAILSIKACDLSPGLAYDPTNYIYPDLKISFLTESCAYFATGSINRAMLIPKAKESGKDSYEAASKIPKLSRALVPRPPYSFGMATESGLVAIISLITKAGKPLL